jgi:ADP-ribosylglycohydrolase
MRRPDRDQFAGCLIGQCLGDAAGFVVERQPPNVCRRYVDEVLKARRVQGQRRGEFGFGQYSDDSQLARELLQSYADRRTFDPSDYARRIVGIFRENPIVGCGWATLQAAQHLMDGWPGDEAGASEWKDFPHLWPIWSPTEAAGNTTSLWVWPINVIRSGMTIQTIGSVRPRIR